MRNRPLVGSFVVLVLLSAMALWGAAATGQETKSKSAAGAGRQKDHEKKADKPKDKPVEDSADRDYADELPRIPAVEPADVGSTFTVRPGFQIELVAAEPLVADPVAVAFDENSRLYVVEMRGYSENAEEHVSRIRLLEDTNGDGRFDKSTIFVDGLAWPTAVTCWDGGVFVGDAPDILYFKDTDDDGVADERRVVYTGFGRGNVQGLMNSFTFALDNRIHGATSSSGADVRLVETGPRPPEPKGTSPSDPVITLRGRDFAFDPHSFRLEPTSGGAQHGMSFNAWGEKFVSSNSDHLQMVMFEDRYVARNPYLAAPGARQSIAADGPQADVFRTSPIEPWRIVRTRLRVQGIVPGPVEGGGTPAGYFTGATGVTIFRGTAWPAEYLGYAIVGDVGSNLIHRKRLDPNGIGYVGKRVDEKCELISSNDIWFRPCQFANAPDGALYVLDVYREVIEHPLSLPPVIKKHLDLNHGRDRGRLYRIVGDGFRQPALPKLGSADARALVATLDHPNGWHRETAARLLYERQDSRAVTPLQQLAAHGNTPAGRMHALYALDGLDALSVDVLLAAMDDAHPRVRQHAVRLSEKLALQSPELRERMYGLVADQSPHVRYQLAFSLGQLDGQGRLAAIAAILRSDVADPYFRLAAQSSLGEGAGAVLAELASDQEFLASKDGVGMLRALAAQIGKQQRADDVAAVMETAKLLASPDRPGRDRQVLQQIVEGLAAKQGTPLEKQIAAATGGLAAEVMGKMLADAAKQAGDADAKPESRAQAVRMLRMGSFDKQAELFDSLLEPAQPADLQSAALDTLSAFESPRVAGMLIERWPGLSPRLRSRAGDLLASRTAWLKQLLDAIEEQRIAASDLEPGRLKLLAAHGDESIRAQAAKLAAKNSTRGREDVIKMYRDVLDTPGDIERGRAAFRKVCAACHRVENVGHQLAPNLAAMRNRGPEAILLNVLDPNREVNPQYVNYTLVTQEGRLLSGIISDETATSVTLKRGDGATDVVLRIDIGELRSTGLSLMPEGLEKQIDKQTMADLMAYLKSVE